MEESRNYVKEIQDMLDNTDISVKPKKFRFTYGSRYFSKKFIDIDLIPHIDYTYDAQMDEGWMGKDKIEYYGIIEYSLTLNWLSYSVGVTYTRLTNKWVALDN